MQKNIIGLILAGGLAKRFEGQKCLAYLKGKPLIQWAYQALEAICDEIWLSISHKTTSTMKIIPAHKVIFDKEPGSGPLIAFLQALENISSDALFLVAACDQPLLVDSLLRFLIKEARKQPFLEAVVCLDRRQKLLPFPGVYNSKLGKNASTNLKISFQSFLSKRNIKTIPVSKWQRFDPAGLSFFNINYKKDLALAEKFLNNKLYSIDICHFSKQ